MKVLFQYNQRKSVISVLIKLTQIIKLALNEEVTPIIFMITPKYFEVG